MKRTSKKTHWILKLECGHTVRRRIRYRYFGHMRIEDQAPTWVYCEKCAEKES